MNSPFFSKRESPTFPSRLHNPMGGIPSAHDASNASSRIVERSGSLTAKADALAHSASKLTVGPNIKLKGVEITDCDTLVVEGMVEATMNSRVIQIASQGAFHGSADIDVAEIHGEFKGSLTARKKLIIHSTGKVMGKIRYGKLVVEEGGQIAGEIEMISTEPRLEALAIAASSTAVVDQ